MGYQIKGKCVRLSSLTGSIDLQVIICVILWIDYAFDGIDQNLWLEDWGVIIMASEEIHLPIDSDGNDEYVGRQFHWLHDESVSILLDSVIRTRIAIQ